MLTTHSVVAKIRTDAVGCSKLIAHPGIGWEESGTRQLRVYSSNRTGENPPSG